MKPTPTEPPPPERSAGAPEPESPPFPIARFHRGIAVLGIAAVLLVVSFYAWDRATRPAVNAAAPAIRIDVNHADFDTLNLLPGIGETLAARIIEARQRGGPFRNAKELSGRVSGIGPKTAERLEPYVEFK